MKEQELWQRYALALHLIPDLDVAGDLFMDTQTEAALRRKAARWRRANNLPAEAGSPAGEGLSPDQQIDALRLWRRGRLRRGLRALGLGAASLLLIAGAFLWQQRETGLTTDPAFAARPLGQSEVVGGMRLSVLRTEATPGAVTVWWDVTGRPMEIAQSGAPKLLLPGHSGAWIPALENETALARSDRMVGRSVFPVLQGGNRAAVLQVSEWDGESVQWLIHTFLIQSDAEPSVRSLSLNQTVSAGNYRFTVQNIRATPAYTLVSYKAEASAPDHWTRHLVRLEAKGADVRFMESFGLPITVGSEVQVLFGPLPEGATGLALHFDLIGRGEGPIQYKLPSPRELREFTQSGHQGTAVIGFHSPSVRAPYAVAPLPPGRWSWPSEEVYFVDEEKRRHHGVVTYGGEILDDQISTWTVAASVPVEAEGQNLELWLYRPVRVPGLRLEVDF